MRRLCIIVILALVAVIVAARPAAANLGESNTSIGVQPSTSAYGQTTQLTGTVSDSSGSCLTNGICDTPRGQLHWWYADPNRPFDETKVKMAEADLVPFGTQDRSTAEADYCCLPVGTWLVRGFYVPPDSVFGPGNYQGEFDASSGDTTAVVTKGGTSTSLSQSSASSAVGETVTFTATVSTSPAVSASAAKPSGTVDLIETLASGTSTRTVTLNQSAGTATFTVSNLTAGSHTFRARYQGDGNYNTSDSSPPITHTVAKRPSQTSLSTSATSVVFGQSVTFTAAVTPAAGTGTPTGTVTFEASDALTTVTLGTRSLSGGSATLATSILPVGSYLAAAVYSGDGTFDESVSNTVGVSVSKGQTSTGVSASPASSTYGQSMTFSASVSPVSPATGSPSGTVQFKDGGTALGGPRPISNGVASLSTATLPAGTHEITAEYQGDGNFETSTSSPLSYVVSKADTSTVATPSVTSSEFGDPVTFTATLSVVPPGAGAPTGTVQFKDGTADLGRRSRCPPTP